MFYPKSAFRQSCFGQYTNYGIILEMKPFTVRSEGKVNLHEKCIEIPDDPHDCELFCGAFQNYNYDFYIGQYTKNGYK